MSITDELREFASHCAGGMGGDSLRHIADHIDAEAEDNERFRREAEPFYDRLREAAAEMAEVTLFGVDYVPLPVDADGEVIHVGDELDVGFVARIVITDGEWPPYLYAYKETPHILTRHFCNEVSHHHEPTVEDVLREMCLEIDRRCERGSIDYDELFAEYAKKLRLAGDGE